MVGVLIEERIEFVEETPLLLRELERKRERDLWFLEDDRGGGDEEGKVFGGDENGRWRFWIVVRSTMEIGRFILCGVFRRIRLWF